MNPLVVKLGGSLLDSEPALADLFAAIANYRQHNSRPLVIVHGGGCMVDELMHKLALPVERRNGLRVTHKAQIDISVGALAGTANKTLLSAARKQQLPAIGLCLADGESISVTQISDDLGHVGEAAAGKPGLISQLLANQYLPIMSSIGLTDNGELMNVNADHAAVALAQTLNADLVLLSDVAGVLDAHKQRIPELTAQAAQGLIAEGVITDGMIVKVNSALEAAKMLQRPIDIASWREVDKLTDLFNGKPTGTRMIA